MRYIILVIKSFGDKTTMAVYNGEKSRYSRRVSQKLHGKIARLLDQINVVSTIEVLKVPPSNRLEKLKGELKGFWSLRVNDQWRIVFRWENNDAYEVKITDYH